MQVPFIKDGKNVWLTIIVLALNFLAMAMCRLKLSGSLLRLTHKESKYSEAEPRFVLTRCVKSNERGSHWSVTMVVCVYYYGIETSLFTLHLLSFIIISLCLHF